MGKFVTNIGPNTVIGAFTQGEGATARGSVRVGGATPKGDRLRGTIEVCGTRDEIDEWLRQVRKALIDERDVGAIGEVEGGAPSGCAWTIKAAR